MSNVENTLRPEERSRRRIQPFFDPLGAVHINNPESRFSQLMDHNERIGDMPSYFQTGFGPDENVPQSKIVEFGIERFKKREALCQ